MNLSQLFTLLICFTVSFAASETKSHDADSPKTATWVNKAGFIIDPNNPPPKSCLLVNMAIAESKPAPSHTRGERHRWNNMGPFTVTQRNSSSFEKLIDEKTKLGVGLSLSGMILLMVFSFVLGCPRRRAPRYDSEADC